MRLILSASAFINAVPKLNSDRGPGMPAARKVRSHHGYRSCRLGCVTACREDFRGDLATISIPVHVRVGQRHMRPERAGGLAGAILAGPGIAHTW